MRCKLSLHARVCVCVCKSVVYISDLCALGVCMLCVCFYSDGWVRMAAGQRRRWAAASAPHSTTTRHPETTGQTGPRLSVHTPGYMASDLHTQQDIWHQTWKNLKTFFFLKYHLSPGLWFTEMHVIGWNKAIWRIYRVFNQLGRLEHFTESVFWVCFTWSSAPQSTV